MKFNFDTRLTIGVLLLLIISVALMDETFAYNLQGVRFLPRGDGINGQQGVVLGVTSLIQGIANGLAALAGAVAVLFIVINGARMTFSFGDTEALSKARKGLVWSMAGLLLVVFAYVIAKSVVALVYSGEGVGTATGVRSQMTFNVNEYTRTCKAAPVVPNPCYSGEAILEAVEHNNKALMLLEQLDALEAREIAAKCDSAQENSAECAKISSELDAIDPKIAELENKFSEISAKGTTQLSVEDVEQCQENVETSLENNGVCSDMGIEGQCTISAVQGKANYEGLPNSCSQQDGKYGVCTMIAIKRFYDKDCGVVGGSVNGLGSSSAETMNPLINQLTNRRQAIYNEAYILQNQVESMNCEDEYSAGCQEVEAQFRVLLEEMQTIDQQMDDIQRAAVAPAGN